MGIIENLFTSVSQVYNSYNPITLGGVNDIIVIKSSKGEYKCTPFHLRFSKLHFYSSKSHIVNVYVNGKITGVTMTITSQGDLYFNGDNNVSSIDKEEILDKNWVMSIILENPSLKIPRINWRDSNVSSLSKDISELSPNKDTNKILDENPLYKINHFSYSANNLDKFNRKNNFIVKDDSDLIYPNLINTNTTIDHSGDALDGLEDDFFLKERIQNLNLRIHAMKKLRYKSATHNFNNLFKIYEKFSHVLSSVEYWELMMEKYFDLVKIFELIYTNEYIGRDKRNFVAKFEFSKCMWVKIVLSDSDDVDKVFDDFLCTEVGGDSSLVVRVTAGGEKFYLSYEIFCKIYFELRVAPNRAKKLLDIIEEFYNKNLRWSWFGEKKVIKRDVRFSLSLSSEEIGELGLLEGKNDVDFKVSGMDVKLSGTIYCWSDEDKLVVSDVDGTITKSDILGHVAGFIGTDWTHPYIASFYTKLYNNGYKIIYLSSRSLGQSDLTKAYLRGVNQENCNLPEGPVILNPEGLFTVIYKEVILRNPEEFKKQVLKSILNLFPKNKRKGVFAGGFGNKINDFVAYREVGIEPNRIFLINPDGKIFSRATTWSYQLMNSCIDSIFPNLKLKEENEKLRNFNDMNWWGGF